MGDFYVACREKVQNATDLVATINELAANSSPQDLTRKER